MAGETIDTTIGALAEAEAALQRLAAARMPIVAAYRLSRISKAVTEELRGFQEARERLVRAHGTERAPTAAERAAGAGPTVIEVIPGSPGWLAFLEEARALAAEPVSLATRPFDLASVPTLEISPADLVALGSLVITPAEE